MADGPRGQTASAPLLTSMYTRHTANQSASYNTRKVYSYILGENQGFSPSWLIIAQDQCKEVDHDGA